MLPPIEYPAVATSRVIARDLNGDDAPDLVTGGIMVLLNDGEGGFGEPSSALPEGAPAGAFALADLNGDGELDLSTASGSLLGVAFGRGDGTFDAAPLVYLDGVNSGDDTALEVSPAEIDGEGPLEIVVHSLGGFFVVSIRRSRVAGPSM
ncbi:MAG TPA: VCBS repeat-containing protein [Polyangiaceae bacterium]|nr:VCBS repeat-containing protein [Polyangiaceae bacterium]